MKENTKKKYTLYLVAPCYNEEAVLPLTYGIFVEKLNKLIKDNRINKNSKVLFVNDG